MCGIAGFVNYEGHQQLAESATGLLAHRGPDASGTWSNEQLSLAHRRLSIIDLDERSNQPFEKQGLVLVYNGEIYNYKEIKRDLESKGVSFHTDSDTEVILEAYRQYGANCLDRLDGMFAFAIWDQRKQVLFLARDPFGIKPLYFHQRGNEFAFASELKSLARLLPVDRRISPTGLASLLTYLWIPPEFCILENFHSLLPGHHMTVGLDGNIRTESYWHVVESDMATANEDELCERLDAALNTSVDRHLVADVEVGAFLSGGLDSSLLCALAAKKVDRLQTYTIGTEASAKKVEQMSSDEVYARSVADQFGFKHHEIVIQPDLIKDTTNLMAATDEPIGDPAIVNTRLICQGARDKGVKVLLSGMGADEIFFGYRRQKAWLYGGRYQTIPQPARWLMGAIVNRMPVRIGKRGLRSARWAKKFLSFAELDDAARYQSSFSYYSKSELETFLEPPWRNGVDAVKDNFNEIFERRFPNDAINRLCYTDTQLFLPGLNLAYTDRASMAASTEVRVPFVTKNVIELAMNIPGNFKFRNGRSKHILKRVAERHLPKEIVDRPKASFGAPLRAWISNDLRPLVDDLLTPDRIKHRGWVDPDRCLKMIEADRKGRMDFSYQIYQLLILELWAQNVLD